MIPKDILGYTPPQVSVLKNQGTYARELPHSHKTDNLCSPEKQKITRKKISLCPDQVPQETQCL